MTRDAFFQVNQEKLVESLTALGSHNKKLEDKHDEDKTRKKRSVSNKKGCFIDQIIIIIIINNNTGSEWPDV